jgi:hypothetical protein
MGLRASVQSIAQSTAVFPGLVARPSKQANSCRILVSSIPEPPLLHFFVECGILKADFP